MKIIKLIKALILFPFIGLFGFSYTFTLVAPYAIVIFGLFAWGFVQEPRFSFVIEEIIALLVLTVITVVYTLLGLMVFRLSGLKFREKFEI